MRFVTCIRHHTPQVRNISILAQSFRVAHDYGCRALLWDTLVHTMCVNMLEEKAGATYMERLTLGFSTQVVSTDKACGCQLTNLLAVFRDTGLHPLFSPSTDYLRLCFN